MAVLGKLREELAVRHYARRTVKSYVLWVRRYLEFHGRRHPREMGATYIHAFLSHLATDLGVSARPCWIDWQERGAWWPGCCTAEDFASWRPCGCGS
jgi:hypothetical protein